MRLRTEQIEAMAQLQRRVRTLTHARAWADLRSGARLDLESATVRSVDAQGREEIARFDAYGLIELRTPEGRAYSITHDIEGRVTHVGAAGGSTYAIRYDDHGSPNELTRDGGRLLVLRPAPDVAEGRDGVVAELADGAQERLEYANGLLVRAVDGAGGDLHLERDALGAVRRVVDPRGHATSFLRDPLDPLGVTIRHPDGTEEVWTSQADELHVSVAGALHGRVQGNDATERTEFADHDFIEVTWSGDKPVAGINAHSRVEFRYDDSGRVIGERQGGNFIDYRYDEAGNLTAILTADGQRNFFTWDADGLLRSARDDQGGTFELAYDLDGVVSKLRFPNGVETHAALASSGTGDLCTIRTRLQGALEAIVEERATLDLRGRVVDQISNGRELAFRYDGAGRIVEARDVRTGESESFAWDASSNRIRIGAAVATFDARNRIDAQGGERFTHDDLGRMTQRAGARTTDYAYDGQGNLLSVTRAGVILARYTYDAFGRRISKQCGDRITHFLWAGRQLLRESTYENKRLIERRDYLFVPVERHPLGVRINGALHCYHVDRTGTPLALTNERGEVVWRADYDVFGGLRTERWAVRQPLRHIGQYHDEESGLHYNTFRYYDPELGRYLTPDPLRYRSGTHNFYTYANGDPINQRDPDGHLVFLATVAIVAGAALIGGLIGGAIGAATAEPGKRAEGFAKGFGWGALAGAAGAAVPIAGAAAGLGTAAVAGLSLTADGIVSGVEACTEGGWSAGTFAKAAGISVAATAATLGLAKIPGVKRALGAAGKRFVTAAGTLKDSTTYLRDKAKPTVRRARGIGPTNGGGPVSSPSPSTKSRVPGMPPVQADQVLKRAIVDCDRLLTERLKELDEWNEVTQKSFERWFGTTSESARRLVGERIRRVQEKLKAFDLENFSAGADGERDCFAYVDPTDDTMIYLGDDFQYAAAIGRDSKPGVLAHEISHFHSVGRTEDYEYGELASEALARSNSTKALKNADSFEYFVEGG